MKDGQYGQETVVRMSWLYCMKLKRKNGFLCTKSGKEGNSHGNETGNLY